MYREQEVRRGMDLLDEVNPGWEKQLEGVSFDMFNPYTCVLGRLYGGYNAGVKALDIDSHKDEDLLCGFSLAFPTDETWDKLGITWETLIQERNRRG